MRKRNGLIVLSVIMAATLALSGCGGGTADSKAETKESKQTTDVKGTEQNSAAESEKVTAENDDPVTITFSTFNQWYNDGLKAGIAKYEEITGNKVEVQVYPDDQFTNLILTKVATGDVPDIIGIHPNTKMWPSLLEKVEPLEGEWVDKIIDSTKSNVLRSSDGKVVSAPYGACSSLGVTYNKKIFEEAGIELPMKSYDELLAACEKIKSYGITPVYMPNKDNWTAQIFLLCSLNAVFEKDASIGEKIMSNQIKPSEVPEFVQMCKRLVELKEKGYMNDNLNSATFDMGVAAVSNGEAAMFLDGDWGYADYQKDYADQLDNIGFMPVTLDDDYLFANIGASGYGLWVPTEAKNKEAAKEFIDIFMSEEVLKEVYQYIPGICPIEGYDVDMSPWNEEMLGYAEAIPTQDDFKGTYLTGFNVGNFSNYIQAMLADQPVEQALDDWYGDYAKLNKAEKTPGFE